MQVAAALLADPFGRHWGYQLGQAAAVSSGAMYPMLSRFLDLGWLTSDWEDPAQTDGRPPRRYYELTDEGRRGLAALVAAAPTRGRGAVGSSNAGWTPA